MGAWNLTVRSISSKCPCLPGSLGRELLASYAVVHLMGYSPSEVLLFELLVGLRIQWLHFAQGLLRLRAISLLQFCTFSSFCDTLIGQLLTNASRTSSECWWHGDACARGPTRGNCFHSGISIAPTIYCTLSDARAHARPLYHIC